MAPMSIPQCGSRELNGKSPPRIGVIGSVPVRGNGSPRGRRPSPSSFSFALEMPAHDSSGSHCPEPSLYLRCARAAAPDYRAARRAADANGYLPRHPHPRDRRGLAVHRPSARPDGGPHHNALPARADDDRQRHRAHCRQFLQRLRHRQDLLPAERRHPHANAQVTAISQTLLKQMPPGATPPLILNYSASTVPIIQVALSGEGLTEQNLADIGINQLRTPLVTVPGAAIPYPFGGKQRQIQIDLNSTALQARGLSGQDVANALAAQNLITPVGTQKIGSFEYTIQLNNSPLRIEELGDLPVKAVNNAMVYVRDVATVRDGNPPQTN